MSYRIQKIKLIKEVQEIAGANKVICALSGGVDSSVVALLINKAIKKNLICIMVDTGLLRKNEFKYSFNIYKEDQRKKNIKPTESFVEEFENYLKRLREISL